MRLKDQLDGRRILITGVTGFVGEALLQRLLTDLPGAQPVALVRPKAGQPGRDRIAALLRKPTFAAAAEAAGGVDALLDKVAVVEGDLGNLPDLPADLDVVVHCAGDVSFDPPIQDAFRTNVVGTHALVSKVLTASQAGAHPIHYVHVSTAYVGGRRRGAVPERSVAHDVDWRTERDAGLRVGQRIEDDSRSATVLAELSDAAEKAHGRAGPITAAEDAEKRRREWVKDQQKAAGYERARSLGWTDVYTFTKAMGERVVEELTSGTSPDAAAAPAIPVSIVRPSIIESALAWPRPGWIEGFKMAEPIILAYGRGDLPDFPGVPDSTIDIIPVDYVVSSILAAAAAMPEVGRPNYFTVCSGARNPLSFHRLYELVREFFQRNPLEQRDRGALRVPEWQWPGAERVDQLLRLGDRAHRTADRVVSSLPRSDRTRDWARSLDRQKRRIDFLRRYFDLYRPYAEAELQFTDDNTLALYRSLHPDDAASFAFDAAAIDWHHYIAEVHVPAVTEPLRAMSRGRSSAAGSHAGAQRELPSGDGIVAVFDMDGTLLPSNVVESYLWLRLPELSNARRAREVTEVARALPRWLLTERRDRGAFLRSVYRRYEGADYAELLRIVDEDVTETVLGRLSAAAVRTIRAHRAAGHRTILITGAVAPLVRPVEVLFDEIVAADLEVGPDGRCTGFLSHPPLVGEGRAAWLKHRAASEGWNLAASYGYADSASDLPMLRSVGHPVAVDPDIALSRVARRSRWPMEMWHAQAPVGRGLERAR